MDRTLIDNFAKECDRAIDSGDIAQINLTIENLLKLEEQNNDDETVISHILYCLSNLYTEKARLTNEFVGNWRKDIFHENNILALNYLRKALSKINENSYPNNLLEIQTNTANSLNAFCRVIEANYFWTFDYNFNLPNDANFVAPYRRALTLRWLSQFLNDPGHSDHYNFMAYKLLKSLRQNSDKIQHPGIKNDIRHKPDIVDFLKYGEKMQRYFMSFNKMSEAICYETSEELNYRIWCLDNLLFLNPMNDITNTLMAAKDILQFPNYIIEAGEGPFFSSAFSDIKNRYCKARYLLYCAVNKTYPGWLEDKLYLIDTLDFVDYSTNTENFKIAFKLCFSVLDSLAMLLNQYFKIYDEKCSFTSSWIRQKCCHLENPFIDSLYWLSCDLTDINKTKNWKAPNPNASCLRILRNDFEHNWVRIVDYPYSIWNNKYDYAKVITKNDLESITMEMFRYTRSAILYFTFAVTFQEKFNKISNEKIVEIEPQIYNATELLQH